MAATTSQAAPARHAAPNLTQRLSTGQAARRWLQGRWFPAAAAAVVIVCAGLLVGVLMSSSRASGTSGRPGTGTAGLPAGYHWYSAKAQSGHGATGFSMAVPQGWTARRRGTVTVLRGPADATAMRVVAIPAGTRPVTALRELTRQAGSSGRFPDYRQLAISPFPLRGSLAISLQFAYLGPGGRQMRGMSVIARFGPLPDRQTREFTVIAPRAGWGTALAALREALGTFTPHH